MLERLPDLALERPPAHSQISGRTKEVQDTGPRMTGSGPARMHDEGMLESTLVARLTNERQEP
jgi:hypothetical protein